MNIIQSMRLSRMRIVLIAVVLAVAGLLVSASQIAPAGAATSAAGSGGPKPTIVLEHGAWADGSSWDGVIGLLIGTADHVIPPAEQLLMSKRASAHITEVDSGHLSLISHPGAVTRVIIAAAQAIG